MLKSIVSDSVEYQAVECGLRVKSAEADFQLRQPNFCFTTSTPTTAAVILVEEDRNQYAEGLRAR